MYTTTYLAIILDSLVIKLAFVLPRKIFARSSVNAAQIVSHQKKLNCITAALTSCKNLSSKLSSKASFN